MSDEQGYIVRRSVLEEGTRPEYIIPVGSADGVWGMIKRIGRFRGEGWLALWKGTRIAICRLLCY
jgi:fusion and transport protein UGO1